MAGTCLFSWTDEWWVGDAAVEGWRFGLTREDRSRRQALAVAEQWNRRTAADLRHPVDWPSISVVVCAYNAAETLEECLTHACALDYPRREVIVVDDGSTDATAAIAARHQVRLATIDHAGLATARNEGLRLATGDLVAYLDADAYPPPEWPHYLALVFIPIALWRKTLSVWWLAPLLFWFDGAGWSYGHPIQIAPFLCIAAVPFVLVLRRSR